MQESPQYEVEEDTTEGLESFFRSGVATKSNHAWVSVQESNQATDAPTWQCTLLRSKEINPSSDDDLDRSRDIQLDRFRIEFVFRGSNN